jgi:hypothetical protein
VSWVGEVAVVSLSEGRGGSEAEDGLRVVGRMAELRGGLHVYAAAREGVLRRELGEGDRDRS